MNGVLARYLRRRVASQVLALVLVLTALMQLLELLDVTTDVLDRNLGMGGLARYALLRTPSEILVALPLAVLLGSMSAFYAMARNHEIVAMRCAGMSLKRFVLLLLPVARLRSKRSPVRVNPACRLGLKTRLQPRTVRN